MARLMACPQSDGEQDDEIGDKNYPVKGVQCFYYHGYQVIRQANILKGTAIHARSVISWNLLLKGLSSSGLSCGRVSQAGIYSGVSCFQVSPV